MDLTARICTMSPVALDESPLANQAAEDAPDGLVAWHPSPGGWPLYAVGSFGNQGKVYLVDGRLPKPIHIWTQQQLWPGSAQAAEDPDAKLTLMWSPTGDTLAVSQRGLQALLNFAPEV